MKLINLVPLKEQSEQSEQTPLEVIAHDDNQIYYIDPRDIETYIHGQMVVAMEKLGSPSKELTRDNSDATLGQIDNKQIDNEYKEGDEVKFNPEIMKDKGFENDITHYDDLIGVVTKVSSDELEIKLNKSITPPGGGNIDGILLMKSEGDYEMITK